MKAFAFIIMVVGLVPNSFATAQMSEWLIYGGLTNRLCTLPLESYLKEYNLRLYKVAPPKKIMLSTACWRGYIGTWQIKEGFLWLVNAENLDKTSVSLSKVFTNQVQPIKATWYSGTLHVTQGKMLNYVHAEFDSEFERDIFIVIKNGKVISEKVINNKAP